jgi:glycosyltransferase involved in cell wall biosynthesis
LLARAVRSVVAQSVSDLEIIVVDDGSTPAVSASIWPREGHQIVVVRNQDSLGVSGARNKGIAAATGKWIAFLDDDDVWAPGKIAHQLRALDNDRRSRWCFTGSVIVDEKLRCIGWQRPPLTTKLDHALLSHDVVPGGGSGVLVAADLIRSLGGFDVNLSSEADWEMWIRLCLTAPSAAVPGLLVAWTLHGRNMSGGTRPLEEVQTVLDRYRLERNSRGVRVDWGEWWSWAGEVATRRRDRVEAVRWLALAAWAHKDWRTARRAALAAVWPHYVLVRDWRSRRRMPPDVVDAVRWLEHFREADRSD